MHSELSRLEQFVEKLLANTVALRQQQADLEARLQAREQLIDELRDTLAAREAERSAVNQRLSRVVGQLEEWEQSLAEAPVAAETRVTEGSAERVRTAETAKVVATAEAGEAGEAGEVPRLGTVPRQDEPSTNEPSTNEPSPDVPSGMSPGPMAAKSGAVAAAPEPPVQHNLFSMVGGRG